MKRILAMLLAAAVMLSLSVPAFAAESGKATADYRSEERVADITVEKLYEITGSDDEDLYPQEVLSFTAMPDASNPDTTNLTVDDLTVTGNTDQLLTIRLPVYSLVGTYKYTIAETTEKEMQGVTYSDASVAVTVLVTYNYEEEKLDTQIVLGTGEAAEGKVDTFVNQYDVGKLTLEKTVTGNLGAKDVYFDIAVTFTASKEVASEIPIAGGSFAENPAVIAVSDWEEGEAGWSCTKVLKLKDTDLITFADIPAGVSYAVEEDAKHLVGEDGFDVNSSPDTDYTVAYENETGTIAAASTAQASVTNEKKTTVETGILLDSAPYALMFAVAAAGLSMNAGRKRRKA